MTGAAPPLAVACPAVLGAGDLIGQYEIVERLGQGGAGLVFKVRRGTGVYALKLVNLCYIEDEDDERQRMVGARSVREFTSLMRVRHPNLLRVYSFELWPEPDRGYPCIVSEYVDGPDVLRWRCEAEPTLVRIVTVLAKLADALAQLHAAGLYHRDVKASNILVRREADEPVLIDLGIAWQIGDEPLTMQGEVVGTCTHLAPEYVAYLDSPGGIRGEPFSWTPQIDLYAFGCVAYELLTDRHPVSSADGSMHAVLSAIKNDPVTPVRTLNPSVPERLALLVMHLLEKDPAARPASADHLRDELEQIASSLDDVVEGPRPGHGDPPSPLGRGDAGDGEPSGASRERAVFEPVEELGDPNDRVELDDGPEGNAADDAGDTESRADQREDELPSAIREVRAQLERSAGPQWSRRRLAVAAAGAIGCVAVVAFAFGGRSKNDGNLLARLQTNEPRAAAGARAASSRDRGKPAMLAQPSAAPAATANGTGAPPVPAGDIDAAIAARFGRPTVPARNGAKEGLRATPAVAHPEEDGPLLRSVRMDVPADAPATGPRKVGVPLGAHLRAKLLSNLDSRTIGAGPVEAVLPSPFVARGQVVIPARTMLYGRATDAGGRFSVRFTTLRLPDDTEVAFDGLALDRADNKPGLAPTARIAASGAGQKDGLGTTIARGTGNILLNTLGGGVAEDVARGAGSAVVNRRDDEAAGGSAGAILLDSGVLFEVWVAKAF